MSLDPVEIRDLTEDSLEDELTMSTIRDVMLMDPTSLSIFSGLVKQLPSFQQRKPKIHLARNLSQNNARQLRQLGLDVVLQGQEVEEQPLMMSSAKHRQQGVGKIRAAYDSWYPYFYLDPATGEPAGIFYQVVSDIAGRLNLSLELVPNIQPGVWGIQVG